MLIAGVSVLGAMAVGPRALDLIAAGLTNAEDAADLRALIRDRPAAAHLGHRYLAIAPDERNAPRLVRMLVSARSPRSVREQVAVRMRADYVAGRVVTLDRWVVSRSEGRLFALVAIG